ncbi:DUF3592 domain-containing protein [Micromonospora sp. NPDC126480]|uniref:DUF3592 domain-containing protein n=1 Tax=Micromonospora sp. NPDC126480 TaxID=3155312 RepID=UPI003324707D
MGRQDRRRRRRPRPQSTTAAGPVQREPRSRWRPGYWLRHPAFAAFLTVSFGALTFMGCGGVVLIDAHSLRERGESTTAVVVESRELNRGTLVRVWFTTADGERVSARLVSSPDDLPAVGERLAVVYDSEAPERVYAVGVTPTLAKGWLIIAVGLLLVALYLAYLRRTWHRWRNQAERWRHRLPVPRLGTKQDVWRREKRDDSLP